MTNTQFALLLTHIWLASQAGLLFSFAMAAMALVFLFYAIYKRWRK